MLNWADVYVREEQHHDRVREAEEWRLISECRSGADVAGCVYRPALAWVGHRLVAWGERLEAHYGEPYPESYGEMRHEVL